MRTTMDRNRTALLLAIAGLFGAIAMLRFAVEDQNQAIGFLYAVPISIATAGFAWRGAIVSALTTVALVVLWAAVEGVPFATLAPRLGTSLVVALVIGLQVNKSRRLERERERLVEELQRMAMLDQLTGLANRRSWDERLATELRQAARAGHGLALVAVDLDGLKHANDTLGHQGGDRLIRATAALLSGGLRETDFIARVGGDEFVILLPRCTDDDAARLVEQLMADAPAGHGFSAGVAAWDGRESGTELLGRADRALYRAKAAGGARVARATAATAAGSGS